MMKKHPRREKTEHARSMTLKTSSCPGGVGAERSISLLSKEARSSRSSDYESVE